MMTDGDGHRVERTDLSFASLDEQFARDSHLKREDVARLEGWQRKEPHLPAPLHPIETALFLHSCYYSSEAAKKCIDSFYTLRTHCPEFFANRDPFESEVQQALDTCILTALPDLTPEGHMVFYGRLIDLDPSKFNYNPLTKVYDMVVQMALKERGCHVGHVGIFDLEGVTMAHILKCHPLSVKKALTYLQTALPLRIKSVHFVNGVPFMDKILALIRPFISKSLQNVWHVHYGDNSTIFEFVPKDVLPIECGGSRTSAALYYSEVTRRDIESHCKYFRLEEDQLVDESKRPDKTLDSGGLFGVEGTFKNIAFD